MALETYRKKRKFNVTIEPRGHKARRGGDRFVIQKHGQRGCITTFVWNSTE